MDKLLNMLMGGFMKKFMGAAINHGINLAAGKGKTEAEMSPEEREKARAYSKMAKEAQGLQRMARRFLK